MQSGQSGLTVELYNRIRELLIRCRELKSDSALQAVFSAPDLKPFSHALQSASTITERVDYVLSYVQGQEHIEHGPVLPLFLKALVERYPPEDKFRCELSAIYEEVSLAYHIIEKPEKDIVTGQITESDHQIGDVRKTSQIFPSTRTSPRNIQHSAVGERNKTIFKSREKIEIIFAALAVLVAIIALIPAFGQWLSPRGPISPDVPTSTTLADSYKTYFPGETIPFHLYYPKTVATYPIEDVWMQDNLASMAEYIYTISDISVKITGMEVAPTVTATFDPFTYEIRTSPKVTLPTGAQLHLYYSVLLNSSLNDSLTPALWQAGGEIGDCIIPEGYIAIYTTSYSYLTWGEEKDKRVITPGPCDVILGSGQLP